MAFLGFYSVQRVQLPMAVLTHDSHPLEICSQLLKNNHPQAWKPNGGMLEELAGSVCESRRVELLASCRSRAWHGAGSHLPSWDE